MTNPQETKGSRQERDNEGVSIILPTLNIIAEKDNNALFAHSWIDAKSCLVTIDTGASVTVARPDIAIGLTERDRPTQFALQTTLGENIHILKEALVALILERRSLKIGCSSPVLLISSSWDSTSCTPTMHPWY
jgi:hypothetical protein